MSFTVDFRFEIQLCLKKENTKKAKKVNTIPSSPDSQAGLITYEKEKANPRNVLASF
jgi:hypothetical protein